MTLSLVCHSSEIQIAGFFYKSANEREKLVASEGQFIDDRVRKVIELKNEGNLWPTLHISGNSEWVLGAIPMQLWVFFLT